MSALWKPAGLMLSAFLALAALFGAGTVQAYEISVFNPSGSRVKVEAFVIGSDLACLGLGEKEIAPGGSAKWESHGLCPGGLTGEFQTNEGWQAMNETSCLGAARPRRDWTSCCRDLRFTLCPGPGGKLRFCARYRQRPGQAVRRPVSWERPLNHAALSGETDMSSLTRQMRSWHRYIGFFVVGLTLIYSVSGVLLTFRDTDFLKSETLMKETLSPNMTPIDLGMTLHMRTLKILKQEGDVLRFDKGTYNQANGQVSYLSMEWPGWLRAIAGLHRVSSQDSRLWFAILYGASLLFLAISSFWMYSPRVKHFKRGVYISLAGGAAAMLLLVV